MRSKTIDSVAADLDRGGIHPEKLDYMRTAAVRWMRQCRVQAEIVSVESTTRCLQDCAECIWEGHNHEEGKQ